MSQERRVSDNSPSGLFTNPLVRELTVVLLIKLTILYFIWYFFFSTPVTPQLTSDKVAETIFGNSTPAVSPTNNKSP